MEPALPGTGSNIDPTKFEPITFQSRAESVEGVISSVQKEGDVTVATAIFKFTDQVGKEHTHQVTYRHKGDITNYALKQKFQDNIDMIAVLSARHLDGGSATQAISYNATSGQVKKFADTQATKERKADKADQRTFKDIGEIVNKYNEKLREKEGTNKEKYAQKWTTAVGLATQINERLKSNAASTNTPPPVPSRPPQLRSSSPTPSLTPSAASPPPQVHPAPVQNPATEPTASAPTPIPTPITTTNEKPETVIEDGKQPELKASSEQPTPIIVVPQNIPVSNLNPSPPTQQAQGVPPTEPQQPDELDDVLAESPPPESTVVQTTLKKSTIGSDSPPNEDESLDSFTVTTTAKTEAKQEPATPSIPVGAPPPPPPPPPPSESPPLVTPPLVTPPPELGLPPLVAPPLFKMPGPPSIETQKNLTTGPKELTQLEKILEEIKTTEQTFYEDVTIVKEAYSKLAQRVKKNEVLDNFNTALEKNLGLIERFNKMIDEATNDVPSLLELFETDTGEAYLKAIGKMIPLAEQIGNISFEDDFKKTKNLPENFDTTIHRPAIFAQRLPRYMLLLTELSKNLDPESCEKIKQVQSNINSTILASQPKAAINLDEKEVNRDEMKRIAQGMENSPNIVYKMKFANEMVDILSGQYPQDVLNDKKTWTHPKRALHIMEFKKEYELPVYQTVKQYLDESLVKLNGFKKDDGSIKFPIETIQGFLNGAAVKYVLDENNNRQEEIRKEVKRTLAEINQQIEFLQTPKTE